MQAFIAALDIDYDSLFTCRKCMQLGHTIIIDGKALGVNRKLFKQRQCCVAAEASTVKVEWYAVCTCHVEMLYSRIS